MLENNEGHIINVASIAAFMPGPFMCTYHATKAYLLLLGEAISYEIRKSNVKLLTLCPGPFLSEFVKKAHNDYTFKKIKTPPLIHRGDVNRGTTLIHRISGILAAL